jgi:hypothetical protein
MFLRVALFSAALLWSLTSTAHCAPVPTADVNAALNRQLATIAVSAISTDPLRAPISRPTAARVTIGDGRIPSMTFSPTIAAIAARFASAARIMDIRRGGFDADFWGVFNRSRSIKLGFSIGL